MNLQNNLDFETNEASALSKSNSDVQADKVPYVIYRMPNIIMEEAEQNLPDDVMSALGEVVAALDALKLRRFP